MAQYSSLVIASNYTATLKLRNEQFDHHQYYYVTEI